MNPPPINLPRTSIVMRAGVLYIRHLDSGMEVEESASALDTWCIGRLRSAIAKPKLAIEPTPKRRAEDKAFKTRKTRA